MFWLKKPCSIPGFLSRPSNLLKALQFSSFNLFYFLQLAHPVRKLNTKTENASCQLKWSPLGMKNTIILCYSKICHVEYFFRTLKRDGMKLSQQFLVLAMIHILFIIIFVSNQMCAPSVWIFWWKKVLILLAGFISKTWDGFHLHLFPVMSQWLIIWKMALFIILKDL